MVFLRLLGKAYYHTSSLPDRALQLKNHVPIKAYVVRGDFFVAYETTLVIPVFCELSR